MFSNVFTTELHTQVTCMSTIYFSNQKKKKNTLIHKSEWNMLRAMIYLFPRKESFLKKQNLLSTVLIFLFLYLSLIKGKKKKNNYIT